MIKKFKKADNVVSIEAARKKRTDQEIKESKGRHPSSLSPTTTSPLADLFRNVPKPEQQDAIIIPLRRDPD